MRGGVQKEKEDKEGRERGRSARGRVTRRIVCRPAERRTERNGEAEEHGGGRGHQPDGAAGADTNQGYRDAEGGSVRKERMDVS
ncbi:hypothetical protein CgunFtcFv8_006097 [Champsocephalus gunnari]|uniref:Uncharacterized protein n=1 Tax=Champsocephalus gunnari TaxID=52237 RepID=A0AAN8C134_CHAGU|nr:hypothetical protein CgunFtcFv8_006097 [Champsocephalus gunnari]